MATRTPSGHTTRPSTSPTEDVSRTERAAIRWVHPRPGLSLLTDGHVLGRDPSCDTVLGGDEVSRRHVEVRLRGFVPVLKDLGSRNGVHVNGVKEQESPVGPGDVVRVGDWVGLVVELRADAPNRFELLELSPGWYGGAALAAATDGIRRVARTDLPVIVQGETGTGKEGMARAVHTWSGRTGAFVAVDCGALPEQLAEGALFGHRKGAFTGADRAHDGYFRAAHGGTLFLDEILNLPAQLQPKLLRVLERREVVALGDAHPTPVDVRIVCAAQESLAVAVEVRRFRADLLARLDGLTVVLPPLRERREDIVPLFRRIVGDIAPGRADALEPRFAEALLLYDWPLNVRELVLCARRIVAMHGEESSFRKSMLPARFATSAPRRAPAPAASRSPADDPVEFDALLEALRENDGNLSRAAKAMGVTRARAYRLIQAHPEVDLAPLRKGSD